AILLPFLALVFGIICDFSRVYYVTQTLDNSAYAAALFASGTAWTPSLSSTTTAQAQAAACAEGVSLSPPLAAGNVSISQSGNNIIVTIDYDCSTVTPILSSSGQIHLTRTLTMTRTPTAGQ